MHIDDYIPRIADEVVSSYLRSFGAVCVEGPKWCGKTWTAKRQAASAFMVGDPAGNFQNRRLAETDVTIPLQGESPHLIDEWQEVPPLWDATRAYVDGSPEKGRYILTGSSTPNRKGVMHTGTGRIGSLRMGTMSLWELGESSGTVSFAALCRNELPAAKLGESPTLQHLAELVVRGGWPGAIGVPFKDAVNIPREYIKQVVNNDIHRVDDVKRDIRKVNLLMKSLARNETTTAGIKTLCRDITEVDDGIVDSDTVSSYLGALERMFVIENQPPFDANVRSSVRVKQSPKRHFCDPSIACALLKLTPEKLIGDLCTFGFMFEAMVERDMRAYCLGMGAELFHYQDYSGKELDAVVETADGDWAAIEIKLGSNQEDEAAENLVAIRDAVVADGKPAPKALIAVIGKASATYRRADGVIVCSPLHLRP